MIYAYILIGLFLLLIIGLCVAQIFPRSENDCDWRNKK